MEVKLDKLEEAILDYLKEQTGKSENDLIKLAIYELNRKLADDSMTKLFMPVNNPVVSHPQPLLSYPWSSPWDHFPYK